MIIFAIKSYFFISIDSYSLGQKSHKSDFCQSLYKNIIKVIYIMLAIAIKDLKMQISNSKLLLGKNAIWFESSAQKKEINNQMADALYYKY